MASVRSILSLPNFWGSLTSPNSGRFNPYISKPSIPKKTNNMIKIHSQSNWMPQVKSWDHLYLYNRLTLYSFGKRNYSMTSKHSSTIDKITYSPDSVINNSNALSSLSTSSTSTEEFHSLMMVPSDNSPSLLSCFIDRNEGFTRLLDIWGYSYPWDPVIYFFQGSFELLQSTIGAPWWISIILFSCSTRVLLTPLAIKQLRFIAMMEKIQPLIESVRSKAIYQASQTTPDGKRDWSTALQSQQEVKDIMNKHGVSPFGMFKYNIPQAIFLIVTFITLNRVARESEYLLHHSLKTGGNYWFLDLTLSDPYFILPVLSMATTAGLILCSPMPGRSTTFVCWMVGIISSTTLFFTYSFPVAIHLFWIGSNSMSIITTLIMRSNYLRKLANIPLKVSEELKNTKLFDNNPIKTKSRGEHNENRGTSRRKRPAFRP